MNFGQAIDYMKKDDWNMVAREGWVEKGVWLHKVTPPSSPFSSDGNSSDFEHVPYIEIKTANNKFAPWFPSQMDIFAEDWMIVESNSDQDEN